MIERIGPEHTAFEQAVALFDDYRAHYGEAPGRGRTRDWLAEQLATERLRMAVAISRVGASTPRCASSHDQVAGLITSAVMPASLRLGTALVVRDLFVQAEHRRGGTARALLGHVVAEARAVGALRVSLQTEPDNGPALALYASLGFRPVDGLTTLNLRLS